MKNLLCLLIGCFTIAFSSLCFAECGGFGGGCDSCDPYTTTCQCTDPYCGSVDKTCISTSYCCEAFGNIGGR